MDTPPDIAKAKLSSITTLQKQHYHAQHGETVEGRFIFKPKKTAWCVKGGPSRMVMTNQDDTIVFYKANDGFDILKDVYGVVMLPQLKVDDKYKDKIRFAWCHNIGNNIYEEGNLIVSNKILQKIDSVYHDINSQYFTRGMDGRLFNKKMIGSVPIMEDFSTSHPEFPIITFHPWSFSKNIYNGLPIHISKNVVFRFKLRRRLSELIKMQELQDDGTWKNIHPNISYLNKNDDEVIKIPDYFGIYAKCEDGENMARKSGSILHTVKYDDVISFSSNNQVSTNVYSVTLNTDYPASAIYFVAENANAKEFNDLSNYTNSLERKDGSSPIKRVSLKLKNDYEFQDLPIEHFSMASAYSSFSTFPVESGYAVIPQGFSLDSINIDNGIVLGKIPTTLILGMENQTQGSEKIYYNIYVKVVVNKIAVFREDSVEILGEQDFIQGKN